MPGRLVSSRYGGRASGHFAAREIVRREIRPRLDESLVVERDAAVQPPRVRHGAGHHEDVPDVVASRPRRSGRRAIGRVRAGRSPPARRSPCACAGRSRDSPRCGESGSATSCRPGRARAPACGRVARSTRETPRPGRRNCRRRRRPPPRRRRAAPPSASRRSRRPRPRTSTGSRAPACGTRAPVAMMTARAADARAVVDLDGVRLAVARQPRRALGDHHLRAELLRLRVGAAGQLQPGDAGRKAQVVLDPRARSGLAAGRRSTRARARRALRTRRRPRRRGPPVRRRRSTRSRTRV